MRKPYSICLFLLLISIGTPSPAQTVDTAIIGTVYGQRRSCHSRGYRHGHICYDGNCEEGRHRLRRRIQRHLPHPGHLRRHGLGQRIHHLARRRASY